MGIVKNTTKMSDWEDACDDVLEDKKVDEKKKFEDEDDVDSEEEEKKRKEEARKKEKAVADQRAKNRPKTIDEKWEEKQKSKAGGLQPNAATKKGSKAA